MYRLKYRLILVMVITSLLLTGMATPVLAEQNGSNSHRTAWGMFGDSLFLRPLGFAATVIGAGVFVVSLPFSALGRNVDEAAQKLIVEPAKFTFSRPLGELPDNEGF